jgi:phosphoglycerate dehydrogenase-like enzyme
MKPTALFHQRLASGLVDQKRLSNPQGKKIAGAGLDKDPEPLPAEHPLWIAI